MLQSRRENQAVTDIKVISGSPHGMTESAVKAASQITDNFNQP
jgi:hypothetical protein